MARKESSVLGGTKKSKSGFILSVGDEGAILSHFDKGTLVNRIFVDSPFSPDIKLMKKLFTLYPRIPITIYVDIIEQNYVHTNLPPLSASAVKKQAAKKLARDFQPNDLSTFVSLGREKEGRKDWKYLFISLANTEPFSDWIELALEQKNKFNGVYVLAIESQELIKELNSKLPDLVDYNWELVIMHNKISGFRIIAFNNKKIYFTRLTQHIIGENIAEVVAGNLEQEIVNTIEYLKRLGFSNEQETHVSIIANAEVLKKIELSRMKFGKVDRYTPFTAAEKLGLQYAVKDNDKYADILCAAHFVNTKKKHLKFNSKLTKEIMNLQVMFTTLTTVAVIAILLLLGLSADLTSQRPQIVENAKRASVELNEVELSLKKIQQKQKDLPEDIDLMIEVLDIDKKMPNKEDLLISLIYKAVQKLPANTKLRNVEIVFNDYKFTDATPKDAYSSEVVGRNELVNPFGSSLISQGTESTDVKFKPIAITHSYEGKLYVDLNVKRGELDILNDISANLLARLKDNKDGIDYTYESEPSVEQNQGTETITEYEEAKLKQIVSVPIIIKFNGTISEEKKPD